MTARELPVIEWPRLIGTEAETVWPHLDPAKSHVIVVEDGETIVGCHVLIEVMHVECLWIHPDHRGKAGVARRLWATVRQIAAGLGARSLVTAACADDVRRLLAHLGAIKLEGDHFVVKV